MRQIIAIVLLLAGLLMAGASYAAINLPNIPDRYDAGGFNVRTVFAGPKVGWIPAEGEIQPQSCR